MNISEGAENEDESPCKAQSGSRDAYGSRSKDRKSFLERVINTKCKIIVLKYI